jgi:hypothetical protein
MRKQSKPVYSPALRMKAGELEGLRQLALDVADCILPRFIVPPQSERDETRPLLLDVEEMPNIAPALAAHWRDRPVLIDSTYIIDEYGRDRLQTWLPAMFERARAARVCAIPAALLSDLGHVESFAYREVIAKNEELKFAICVPSDEMVGPEFIAAMNEALARLGLAPADCAVIADFSTAEFSNPDIVAPIISGALETLQELGAWQLIIFQGTHFPDKNPADHGSVEMWPRNEWHAWRRAVKLDPTTAEHMIFGDYAADCAKMVFGKGGMAIRHLRYTTSEHWRIQRGAKTGSDRKIMHDVYKSIVESGQFAGEGFSEADAYIAHAAANANAGPGIARTWRQLNTTHHITVVVSALAEVRGIAIAKGDGDSANRQLSLLDQS